MSSDSYVLLQNYANHLCRVIACHYLTEVFLSLFVSMPLPVGVTQKPLRWVLLLLGLICSMSPSSAATNEPRASPPEEGVTFSHVYKIHVAGESSCKTEALASEGKTGSEHLKMGFLIVRLPHCGKDQNCNNQILLN